MKHTITTLTLFSLLLSPVYLTGCQPKDTPEETAEPGQPADILKLSSAAIRQNKIHFYTTEEKLIHSNIKTTGEIRSNAENVFLISSLVPGRLVDDRAKLGDWVSEGQVVALVQNVEVAKVNANLISQSHVNEIELDKAVTRLNLAKEALQREQQLYGEGIAPRKDLLQAQTAVTLAQAEVAGVKEQAIHIQSEAKAMLSSYNAPYPGLHAEKVSSNSGITAPRSGVITKKNVTLGDVVDPSQPLYEVTDLRKVWLDIVVYPQNMPFVKEGESISFRTDSLPKSIFRGKVTYLQPQANENTQTFVARAFLLNPDLNLRPGMVGEVTVASKTAQKRVFIPQSALQKYGKESFVFTDLGNGRFQKKAVVIDSPVDGGYLVASGLEPGTKIVTQGSFLLKAEMLKTLFREEE